MVEYFSSNSHCRCLLVFRRASGAADSAAPGAAAGGPWWISGPEAGDPEPADPQTQSPQHHQCPGRNQPHPEGVSQQDQVDVSN